MPKHKPPKKVRYARSRSSNPEARKPMNACERGNWIDTEGNIKPYFIRIAQLERQPLEDYCVGAKADGVPCEVVRRKRVYRHKGTKVIQACVSSRNKRH